MHTATFEYFGNQRELRAIIQTSQRRIARSDASRGPTPARSGIAGRMTLELLLQRPSVPPTPGLLPVVFADQGMLTLATDHPLRPTQPLRRSAIFDNVHTVTRRCDSTAFFSRSVFVAWALYPVVVALELRSRV